MDSWDPSLNVTPANLFAVSMVVQPVFALYFFFEWKAAARIRTQVAKKKLSRRKQVTFDLSRDVVPFISHTHCRQCCQLAEVTGKVHFISECLYDRKSSAVFLRLFCNNSSCFSYFVTCIAQILWFSFIHFMLNFKSTFSHSWILLCSVTNVSKPNFCYRSLNVMFSMEPL